MKLPMSYAVKFLILSVPLLVGCRAAHNVAVSSFRVIDAPANYVRRHIDDEGTNTTTTTTTRYQSDSVTPGQPIAGPPRSQRRVTAQRRTTSEEETEGGATVHESSDSRPGSSSSPRRTTASTQSGKIPYAKPVPGKPGYVYSPFDPNGGYVDVTGYASGSKAKDPYSGKIFIVP
jgi:hypothetical protein